MIAVGCGVWIASCKTNEGTQTPLVAVVMRSDALQYLGITEDGYSYSPECRSNVAFFPAFPLAARILRVTLGLSSATALLIVANTCLLGAIFVLSWYLTIRRQSDDDGNLDSESVSRAPSARFLPAQRYRLRKVQGSTYALWAFAFLPTTFFFRMPYSEAMFVFLTIAALYAMERSWTLPWTAALVGLATAVRPVGVALLLPLAWFAIGRSKPLAVRLRRLSWALPLGCWGLLSYMAFQYAQFGDPLAFAKTQTHWRVSFDDLGLVDKAISLSSLEPFWSVYLSDDPGYFGGFAGGEWTRNMRFFNPIFFGGTVALVALGAWKRWLNAYEVLLSGGLLAIPYLTRAQEMCMASHGRFAAVVVPAYIVMGELLERSPRWLACALLAASALGLGFFTARYAAGYAFF
jgi:hypothetical protein